MIPRPIGFISPRVAQLERQYAQVGQPAVDEFWAEIARNGAPLIEPADDVADHSLVTFLWRASTPVSHVVLVSALLHGWYWNGFADSKLLRLADTDVYYRTFLVPNDLCCLYQFAPDMPLVHPADVQDGADSFTQYCITDPLNPKKDVDWTIRSILELPDAPKQTWVEPGNYVPKGKLEECPERFAGLSANQRVLIYTSHEQWRTKAAMPLLVQFDVQTSIEQLQVPTMIDNLIAEGRIPPLVMALLDPSGDRFRDLSCSPDVAQAVAREVVPWIRKAHSTSDDPAATVISGQSQGGLMALYVGLNYSDTFGTVISESSAFPYAPVDDPEPEWLARQFASRPRVPIRVALDVGLLEDKRDNFEMLQALALVTSRHMRDVLTAKGYTLRYHEFCGGHQFIHWRSTLPESLIWALSEGA